MEPLDPSADERGVRVRTTDAGHVRIEVTLDPSDAALVLSAIDKVRDELGEATGSVTASTDRVSAETRPAAGGHGPADRRRGSDPPLPGRADALLAIAERTLAPAQQMGGDDSGSDHDVYEVVVHLDQAVLGPDGAHEAFLDDGTRVSAETFRRVSCDSALVGVVKGEGGAVLDVGRKTRAIPTAIRRALWSRDRGCRFPMCTNRRYVHAHHIQHWAHGGRTSLDNLVLLCGFHHRLLHEGGYKISLGAGDGAPRFFTPRQREIAPVPDTPAAPVKPLAPIDDPDVNLCGWDGEPVDYGAAVDAICAAGA